MTTHDWSRPAIVTGAGSGIGRGSVLAFARRGAPVVVSDVDPARVDAVVAEASSLGVPAVAAPCDVADPAAIVALRDLVLDRFGAAGVVMSNVGVIASGRPDQIPLDEWERLVEVNLLAAIRIQHAFLPTLLAQGSGHLVFTASTNCLYPYSWDRAPYTATKAAVVALAEALALYCRPQGVGVSCLCPGPVATNIVEQMRFHGDPVPLSAPDLAILDPADVGEMVAAGIDENRFLLLTHPEVRDILVRRAQDPEAFLSAQSATLPPP